MSASANARLTVDEFVAWALAQPERQRCQLLDGEIVAMPPERSSHGVAKTELGSKLLAAIRAKRLPCDVYIDSATVRVSEHTAYVPDILVRCGRRHDGEVVITDDPVVIMEVLSRSTRARDTTVKLDEYFGFPTMRHYVIVDVERRKVTHHRRGAAEAIATSIDGGDTLTLDEPGITITDLFETRD